MGCVKSFQKDKSCFKRIGVSEPPQYLSLYLNDSENTGRNARNAAVFTACRLLKLVPNIFLVRLKGGVWPKPALA